ncbi:MAG: hypothetical protein JJT94_08685 [Bernardetiaceae bacterium]|nr:hypothetical protein [Bernardetiaceae bacterium]
MLLIKKILQTVVLLPLLLLGLSGCLTEPNYPDIPQISFLSIKVFPSKAIERADSVVVIIEINDGDGDLGLSPNETNPPFSLFNPDSTENKFFFNYFIEVERLEGDDFEPIMVGGTPFTLNGRFQRLNPEGRQGAMDVELGYRFLVIFGGAFSPVQAGDILRFKIQIADRALNLSNEIHTDPIEIGVRE